MIVILLFNLLYFGLCRPFVVCGVQLFKCLCNVNSEAGGGFFRFQKHQMW